MRQDITGSEYQQRKDQNFRERLNDEMKAAQAKRVPIKRTAPRRHEQMSGPCPCGATFKSMIGGKVVDVPRQFKRCCGRLGAINHFQAPNNVGNYDDNKLARAQKRQAKLEPAEGTSTVDETFAAVNGFLDKVEAQIG